MTSPRKGVCVIVCAGDLEPGFLPEKTKSDFWIAADAGLRAMRGSGIEPDVYIGDGDSLRKAPDVPRSIILPVRKDDTDSIAAVKFGLEAGFSRFCLFGALGGSRISHSAANIQLLSYLLERGGRGILSDAKAAVALLPAREETYRIGRWKGRHPSLSLFAVGGNAVVSISGALYEGEKITLEPSFPLGVSNRPESGCEVRVHEGRVLLILEPGMFVRRPGTLFRAVGM